MRFSARVYLGASLLAINIAALTGYAQRSPVALTSHSVVEVIHDSAALYLKQEEKLIRRGSAKIGARFTTTALLPCAICASAQAFQIESGELLCSEDTAGAYRRVGQYSVPTPQSEVQYAKVGIDGTPVYAQMSEYLAGEYVGTLGEGFQVVVENIERENGKTLAHVKGVGWVENDALRYLKPSQLVGKIFSPEESKEIGWAIRNALIYRSPKKPTKQRLQKYTIVNVLAVQGKWVRFEENAWLRDEDIGRLTQLAPPTSLEEKEKWVDIDLSEQVLIAYEGEQAKFASLIATGRPGKHTETPSGEFRLWVKLRSTDMANIEDEQVRRTYLVQDVPWVQFFKDAYGLHGSYWHDDFGTRKSHGCVNLSPTDAEFLFSWTEPSMPSGWNAILPKPGERATLIRVRE